MLSRGKARRVRYGQIETTMGTSLPALAMGSRCGVATNVNRETGRALFRDYRRELHRGQHVALLEDGARRILAKVPQGCGSSVGFRLGRLSSASWTDHYMWWFLIRYSSCCYYQCIRLSPPPDVACSSLLTPTTTERGTRWQSQAARSVSGGCKTDSCGGRKSDSRQHHLAAG
jgi:hypothetical protein